MCIKRRNKAVAKVIFLGLFAFWFATGKGQQNNQTTISTATKTSFSFTVPSYGDDSTITSAGIYDKKQMLVRTLWAQRYYKPGRHTESWDGADDFGHPLLKGTYTWQLLYNQVRYIWEGVIGNTSENKSGTGIYNGYDPITCMCFAKGNCYFGTSYNEQLTTTFRFDTTKIQTRTPVDEISAGGTPQITDNATDGNYVYWAGEAYDPTTKLRTEHFVYATRVKDDSLVTFKNGQTKQIRYGHSYSVIGYGQDTNGKISSIAVQQAGNYIFIARPLLNQLSIINKTGALIRNFTFTNVNHVRVDASDAFIWLTHNNNITEKYRIGSGGNITATGIVITSAQPVVALSVNNKLLLIGEGGISQQVKAYNPAQGNYLWTYGQPGGYANNAEVRNDKFYWNDKRRIYNTFISLMPSGTFWVGDIGNFRYQHYTTSRSFIERIMFIGRLYNVNVDNSDPSRVFAGTLEFKIEYPKPLLPDNGSWTLVKNWGGTITPAQWSQYLGMRCVNTFPNGKIYFLQRYNPTSYEIIELTKVDTIRHTGTLIGADQYLSGDLNLYRQSSVRKGKIVTWYKSILSNTYNDNNTPAWQNEQRVDTVLIDSSNEPINKATNLNSPLYRPDAITSDGVIISFDNLKSNPGYHVCGIKDGKFVFKTALSINNLSTNSLFPKGNRFEIGHVGNAGNAVIVLDNTAIWGYNGEKWHGIQTNMYTHVYENGLVINQFGAIAPTNRNGVRAKYAYAGDAGNAFYLQLVKLSDGNIYLYHNDEGVHGGIHRWKIDGMNTIKIETGYFK